MALLVGHYVLLLWWQRLRMNHAWLSSCFPSLESAIVMSRPQRLSILCLAIMANMAFSAYFFGTNPESVDQASGHPPYPVQTSSSNPRLTHCTTCLTSGMGCF